MTGSIKRAWIKTQWLGLIIFTPFLVHFYLKSSEQKEYWTWMTLCGLLTIWVFMYFTKQIWKKIQERYVSVLVNKTMNYHSLCMSSLIKEDYVMVKHIMDKCLDKYDPKSQITFFTKGALAVGTKDYRPFKEMKRQIETTKV